MGNNNSLTVNDIDVEKKLRRIQARTQKHLDLYARDGLRTLCIAKKVRINYRQQWLNGLHPILGMCVGGCACECECACVCGGVGVCVGQRSISVFSSITLCLVFVVVVVET